MILKNSSLIKSLILICVCVFSLPSTADRFKIIGLQGINLYVGMFFDDFQKTEDGNSRSLSGVLIEYEDGVIPCSSSSDCDLYENKITEYAKHISRNDVIDYLNKTKKSWIDCHKKYNNKCRFISEKFWEGDDKFLDGLSFESKELQKVILKATQGDRESQFNLGTKFQNGYGVVINFSESVRWYKKAALQNHSKAQYRLGWRYYIGQGVHKNTSKSFYWWQESSLLGDREAQDKLGYSFHKGIGVEINLEKALFWYQKSASNGWPPAMHNLAGMYDFGAGVEKDMDKAIFWYKKATALNYIQSNISLCEIFLEDHSNLSIKWCDISLKDIPMMLSSRVGSYYETETGDFSKALDFYLLAAEKGEKTAMYNIGVFYSKGRGVTKNYCKSVKWYKKSVDEGYVPAMHNLANRYMYGECVEKSAVKAKELYEEAAEQGYQLSIDALDDY